MTASLQAAVDSLIANPEAFLKTRYLGIGGSQVSGSQTYWIQEIDGGRRVRFADQAKYQLEPQANPAEPKLALPVISIPMLSEGSVHLNALNGISLPIGVAKIAVTGQLSGCSYFVARTAIGTLVTHIRPTSNGAQLHEQMARGARFSNQGANFPYAQAAVFGRQFYNSHATVIGIYRLGAWEFWAQKNHGMSKEVEGVMRVL